jgi:predicted secreted acid phosphatase
MEERQRAAIDRLPKNKQAEALAQLEERRTLFEEMAKLSPEERRAKMEERMEQMMNSGDNAAKMSAEGTKRAAMQTAEQRAERYRGYLDRKRDANK